MQEDLKRYTKQIENLDTVKRVMENKRIQTQIYSYDENDHDDSKRNLKAAG